jgi:dipeptidyl aminopeptidase/acylaminoacyl peptidase
MAQHDYNIANQSFPSFRTDLNNALSAVVTNNSGTSVPSTTFANSFFYDETNNVLKFRNEDNDAYITIMGFDQSADTTTNVVTDANHTFTKAQRGSTDTDTTNTGNVTLDFSTNQNFVLTLTGNVTLDNPTTEAVGQSGFITFIQDATGGRTVSLGTDYETAGGAGLTLSSTASATDAVPYIVVASSRILLGTPQLAFS